MKQITVNNCNQKPNLSSVNLVGREAKNPLLTSMSYDWTDMAGLSWIFVDEDNMDSEIHA